MVHRGVPEREVKSPRCDRDAAPVRGSVVAPLPYGDAANQIMRGIRPHRRLHCVPGGRAGS